MDAMPLTTERLPVELQDRDLALLRGLFESRVMTLAHAATLYFGGRGEACKKRVQKLKAAGVVAERPRRRAYDPSVLFLTKRAFAALSERGVLADYPRLSWKRLEKRARVADSTLAHELQVMDVKAAFAAAVSAAAAAGSPAGLEVAEFTTWPLLSQFRAARPSGEQVLVKPDGFMRFREHAAADDGAAYEHTFFLEVDRSTEPQDTLAARAACYADYYRRGGLAARHGRPRSEFKAFPFRVLMVFRNAERRNNAAARMLQVTPPVLTQVWLTTFDEVTSRPLGAIWVQPLDYRAAVASTAFEHDRAGDPAVYRRQTERESLVEGRVLKHSLFCPGPRRAPGGEDPSAPPDGLGAA